MKLNTLLFLSLLTVLTSCNGQSNSQVANNTSNGQHSTIAKGDTVKELGKHLMYVMQDRKNNYWFGSYSVESDGEGVYRYDGKNIIHYTTKHGLCDNKIRGIQEDKSGNIYFNTLGGISKFDGQTFTTLNISGNEWKLQAGDLWFTGAQDSGVVYRYDGKKLHRLKFPATKAGEEFNAQRSKLTFPFSPYDVYTTYNDSKGNLWFGTSSLGVCRFDGKNFTWLSEKDLAFDVETAFGIRSIIEDNDGKFWFSNTLHRFKMFEGGNYDKEKGIDSLDAKNKFDMVSIMSIAKDHDDLWMATSGQGVWRYDDKRLTNYPVKYNGKDITVFSIYKDNNGDLWLGTHETGAYKFNGKTFEKFIP
jgi:ligand-binding sensor domain-containing protein